MNQDDNAAKKDRADRRRAPQRKTVAYSIVLTQDEHRHLQRIGLRLGRTKEHVAATAVRAYLMSGGLVNANGENVSSQEPREL